MTFPQILPMLLGLMIIATRLPGVFNPKQFLKVVTEMLSDEKLMRIFGFHATAMGALFMLMWPYYTSGIYIIFPLLGALTFFIGLNMMWNPQATYKKVFKLILKLPPEKIRFLTLLAALIGCGLIYLGWNW